MGIPVKADVFLCPAPACVIVSMRSFCSFVICLSSTQLIILMAYSVQYGLSDNPLVECEDVKHKEALLIMLLIVPQIDKLPNAVIAGKKPILNSSLWFAGPDDKVWHSTDRYRRVIWQCNAKFTGEHKCQTPHLYEERLKELFIAAMSEYYTDREETISKLQFAQRSLTNTDFIDEDIRCAEQELEITSELIRVCINGNASNTMTEEEYRAKHTELCGRFEEIEANLNGMKQKREKMQHDAIALGGLLFELTELDALPITFNENLWNAAIDHVTVCADERVIFHFKD